MILFVFFFFFFCFFFEQGRAGTVFVYTLWCISKGYKICTNGVVVKRSGTEGRVNV